MYSQAWGREKEPANFLPKLHQGELGARICPQLPLDCRTSWRKRPKTVNLHIALGLKQLSLSHSWEQRKEGKNQIYLGLFSELSLSHRAGSQWEMAL